MTEPAFPAVSAAITAALIEIAVDPDPASAYVAASALGLIGRDLLNTSRLARGVALARLRDEQSLTLSEVADVVRMSKSRASQLISKATGSDA